MAENKLIYTIASSKNFSANFNVKATAPLDTRTVVQNKADLYDVMGTFNGFVYEGMLVTVLSEKAVYQLIAIDEVNTKSNIVAAFDTENFDNNSKLWQQVGKETDTSDLEADLSNIETEINNIKTSYVAADTAIVNSLSSYVSDLEAADNAIVNSLSSYVDELKADDAEIQKALNEHIETVATDTAYGHVMIKNLTDKKLYTDDLSAYNDFAVDVATLVYSYKSAVDYTESYINSTIKELNSSYKGIGTYVDVTVDQESGKITNITIDDSKIVNALQPIEQDLNNHINAEITYDGVASSLHLEAGEREKWNTAANRIDTFMDTEGIDETIDTLHEISYWIKENGSEATDLAKSIAENTSNINELKAADEEIVNSLSSYVSDLQAADKEIVSDLTSYVDELKAADAEIVISLSSYVSDLQAADKEIVSDLTSYVDELKAADKEIVSDLTSYVDELKAADAEIVSSLTSYVSALEAADDEINDALQGHIKTIATDAVYGHVKIKNLNGEDLFNRNALISYNDFAVDVDTLLYAYNVLTDDISKLESHINDSIIEHISYVNAEVTSDLTTYGFVTVSIKQEDGKIVSADIDDSNIQSKLDEYKLDITKSFTNADAEIVSSLTSYVDELKADDAEIQQALTDHIGIDATNETSGHVKLADQVAIGRALDGTSYSIIFDAVGNVAQSGLSSLTDNVITVGALSAELGAIKNTINNKIESLDTAYNFVATPDNNSLISYSYEQVDGIITNLSISTYNVAKDGDVINLKTRVANVEEKLSTFLGENDEVLDTIDTLQEIQKWMNDEGNAATELTTHVAEHCDLINSYVMTPKNNWVTI